MTSRPGPGSVCTNVSATTVLLQTLVNVLADRASRQSGLIITIIIGTKMRYENDNYNGGGDELVMRAVKNQAVYIKNSIFAKYHLNPPLHWHWKLPGVFKHSCKDLLDTVWYLGS